MRIVAATPFGMMSSESGLMMLLLRYLHSMGYQIEQLRCNGVLSVCERDGEVGWRRTPHSCLICMREQADLGRWAQAEVGLLGQYLSASEQEETARWMLSLSDAQLLRPHYEGYDLKSIFEQPLRVRFGFSALDSSGLDSLAEPERKALRGLYLSGLRALLAARRYVAKTRPGMLFLAGGKDLITHSLAYQAEAHKVGVVRFEWQISNRSVRVYHPDRDSSSADGTYDCPLFFTDLDTMRNDPSTWPKDMLDVVGQTLDFLGIPAQQLALMVAR